MEKETIAYKAHCLVVPYPTQGHINPMVQFSKRLEHKGLKVTLASTRFIFKTVHRAATGSITVETISDGYDEGRPDSESIGAYLTRFKQVGSETLTQLVVKLINLGCPVDCIVYDSFMPWALDVARNLGLVGAAYFTQSCAVNNIYYHVNKGLLELPLRGSKILIPGLPSLLPSDMPSFIYALGSYPAIFEMLVDQFTNVHKADWALFNTFYKLEEEEVDWMAKVWPLRTVGPTLPSAYLDKRLQDDKGYNLSVFKPKTDACMNWLNNRPNGSVIYVSFGSLAELGVEQMEELSWGLRDSNKYYFLWVVRESEESKLPKNFVKETSDKGLVVSWCPQLEVLAHKATGCFITHCGWNSTLEGLGLGVPMVAMPQWTDQITNAKYIMDVWGTGLRVEVDGKGIARREMVAKCISEIMDLECEKGKEIRRNARKWKELAIESVDEGGSSDRNIDEFVST